MRKIDTNLKRPTREPDYICPKDVNKYWWEEMIYGASAYEAVQIIDDGKMNLYWSLPGETIAFCGSPAEKAYRQWRINRVLLGLE